jgi:hypothetical protein
MEDRELWAEIVQSGTWLYDGHLPTEVWIVRQNFEYQYEAEYSDREEDLNEDGDAYQVVLARSGYVGPAGLALSDAVKLAEDWCPAESIGRTIFCSACTADRGIC